jgi:hypothetical protein
MALLTFTLTANGAAPSQQLTGAASTLLISGTMDGGDIKVECSPDDTIWAPVPELVNNINTSKNVSVVIRCNIPSGWYVRPVLLNTYGTPSITVVVDDTVSSGGGGSAVVPLDLGAIYGDVTLDGSEAYQYCELDDITDIVGITGGDIGDTVVLEIQNTTGPYTLDLSGVKTSTVGVLPVTLEETRAYVLTFKFVSGGWALADIAGPYTVEV